MIEHECPECGQSIESSDRLAGDEAICPECDASVTVPLLPAEAPTPPPLPPGEDTPPTANLMELTAVLQQKEAEDRKTDTEDKSLGKPRRIAALQQKEAEDKKTHTEDKSLGKPRRIGGWLIIPAIGLVLTPITSVLALFMGMDMIQSVAPRLNNDPRMGFMGVIDVTMIVATIIVAVLFFNKRRIAVPAIIGLMVASFLATIVQARLIADMSKEVDADTVKPVIHAFVFAAIWITYFLNSKRVKYTFTK